jgi:molybdenum cofactor cytidylyltransferase
MNSVSAILLCAGESRRMGAANKLLLTVGEVPLVRHITQILLASMVEELIVVLGHEAQQIERALSGLPVKSVYNDCYGQGQMTSVHAGMEALTQETDGVMVCLSDQPLLTVKDIDALIRAFSNRQEGDVVVPTYRGQRGNPIVLANEYRRTILNGQRNLGCKHLIENNPDIVTTVEWDSDHVVVDIDTKQDVMTIASTQRINIAGAIQDKLQ